MRRDRTSNVTIGCIFYRQMEIEKIHAIGRNLGKLSFGVFINRFVFTTHFTRDTTVRQKKTAKRNNVLGRDS